MITKRIASTTTIAAAGSLAAALIAPLALTSGFVQAKAAPKYTITIQLQPNTGTANSKDNHQLMLLTQAYEKMHPNIRINWQPLPDNTTSITQANSFLLARASAHAAPDVVFEQYGPVNSGAIPKGILLNLKPYLTKPNPYAKAFKTWLASWKPSTVPYMTAPSGGIYILLGSSVATEIVYNKADFAKAGIKSTPTTFAAWLADMAKLKAAGFTPLMFGTGGPCNPSWYERKFQSMLLHAQLGQFDVNHAQVATGLDTAVGVERGIISMKNPAYAEGWKLLGQLRKYLAPGASSYDACSPPTQSSPPLSELQPFVQNKYAMAWMGTWDIPDLNQLGFAGKFGFFPFPTITKATTRYSNNVNVTGVVGGPNGTGEWSVTTKAADASMTPAKRKWVINFLEWLYAPQNEGRWIANAGSNAYVPLIEKATGGGIPGLAKLLPPKFPPVTVDAITNAALTSAAQNTGLRLIQAYVGGSMSYSQFAQQWQALLEQGAQAWAQANHVNLSKYKK